METVGIKEFKANLSSYVHLVQQGGHFIITDRGHAVAELGPLSPDYKAIMALQHAGKAQWSGRKPTGLRGVTVRGKSVAEAIVEDRQ